MGYTNPDVNVYAITYAAERSTKVVRYNFKLFTLHWSQPMRVNTARQQMRSSLIYRTLQVYSMPGIPRDGIFLLLNCETKLTWSLQYHLFFVGQRLQEARFVL